MIRPTVGAVLTGPNRAPPVPPLTVDGLTAATITTDSTIDSVDLGGNAVRLQVSPIVLRANQAATLLAAYTPPSDASAPVLAVPFLNVAPSKAYSAIIGARLALNTIGTPANCGYLDLVAMCSVVTDGAGVPTCTFDQANIEPAYRLKPAIASASAAIVASAGGFTIYVTRVAGINQRVTSCRAWVVSVDEVA